MRLFLSRRFGGFFLYKQVWKFHGRMEHDEREAKEPYTQTLEKRVTNYQ